MPPRRATVVAVLLALALFVPGIWWGLPYIDGRATERGWAIDDETPLGALAEARHAVVRGGGERNPGYPLFYYYASVAAYTPYLGYLVATKQFSNPGDTYPFGLANATHSLRVLSLISKLLTVVFAMAVLVGAYHAARLTWNERAGAIAIVIVALMYPLAYYSRTGNVDVPMLGLTAIGVAALAAIARDGFNRRRVITLGIAAGLALATKDSAVGVFAAVPVVLLAVPRAADTTFPWKSWGLLALAGFLALGIGSGLFVDPANYVTHLKFLAGRLESLPGTETVSSALPMTAAGHLAAARFQVSGLAAVLTGTGLILAMVGVIRFVPRHRRAALLLLPVLTYLLLVFFFLRAEQVRYLLPAGFVLALFAAAAVEEGLRAHRRAVRATTAILFAVTISVALLRYIDLTYAMIRDSRYAAGQWLESRLAAGDRVEFFGASQKLPKLPPGVAVERATPYFGMLVAHDTSSATALAIVEAWKERKPSMIIVIPDHSSPWPGAPFDGSMPPSLFRLLESGELPYRRAARFETPSLLPWIRRPPLDYPMVNPPVHIYTAAVVQ